MLGAFAFLVVTIYHLRPGGLGREYKAPVIIFGFSCVFLFSMSGVYHLLDIKGIGRYVLRVLDHAGIYFLIAGTFTALHGILFKGFLRWGIILLVWILAINGITLGSIFFSSMPEFLSLIFFLSLGWLGIITGVVLWKRKGLRFIRKFLYGGLAYTVGALLEFFRVPVIIHGVIGPHELFHFAVLTGTTFHWMFVIDSMKAQSKRNVQLRF
jgi:channel protein (hemolysin III family)